MRRHTMLGAGDNESRSEAVALSRDVAEVVASERLRGELRDLATTPAQKNGLASLFGGASAAGAPLRRMLDTPDATMLAKALNTLTDPR